ncbi:putative protein S-acyltransferase 23 [Vitis vinifera]|uniref:protein S-acyltransferase n=1 Tax=Vitis vinifera TaxID=29760 RepID=A0A438JN11_VITVI|nr:putative protein S-acyltransferase 23 [Vitis vinifera]
MASPEIEVDSDSKTPKNEAHIFDVFSACAYGDFPKLRKFVEENCASLSKPDGNGYYALHWASLNNFPDIVQYVIEHGGDVNAVDNSQQTALHWSAVRGAVSVADILLQNGARVEAADINGYRPMKPTFNGEQELHTTDTGIPYWEGVHVAAQYGQTAFINHLVAKYHADFDAPDRDGRSPLHWASEGGFKVGGKYGAWLEMTYLPYSGNTSIFCNMREE